MIDPNRLPDHIHTVPGCNGAKCGDDHWWGGRPDPKNKFFAVIDVATQYTIYYKHTAAELAQLAADGAVEQARMNAEQTARDDNLATLRQYAAGDPKLAALLKYLGVS